MRNIELDLEREILEGYEKFYDVLNVAVLRLAVKLGHKLPRVDVVKEGGIYRFVFGRGDEYPRIDNYGGHSRAIVALQERYPLQCVLFDAHRKDPNQNETPVIFSPISRLVPKRITNYNAMVRLNVHLLFLPEKLRRDFIEQNNLILTKDGILMDKEDYQNPPPF